MRARNKFWSPPGWLEGKQVVRTVGGGQGAAAGQCASGATLLSVEEGRGGVAWYVAALLVVDAGHHVGVVQCSSKHLAFLLVIHHPYTRFFEGPI